MTNSNVHQEAGRRRLNYAERLDFAANIASIIATLGIVAAFAITHNVLLTIVSAVVIQLTARLMSNPDRNIFARIAYWLLVVLYLAILANFFMYKAPAPKETTIKEIPNITIIEETASVDDVKKDANNKSKVYYDNTRTWGNNIFGPGSGLGMGDLTPKLSYSSTSGNPTINGSAATGKTVINGSKQVEIAAPGGNISKEQQEEVEKEKEKGKTVQPGNNGAIGISDNTQQQKKERTEPKAENLDTDNAKHVNDTPDVKVSEESKENQNESKEMTDKELDKVLEDANTENPGVNEGNNESKENDKISSEDKKDNKEQTEDTSKSDDKQDEVKQDETRGENSGKEDVPQNDNEQSDSDVKNSTSETKQEENPTQPETPEKEETVKQEETKPSYKPVELTLVGPSKAIAGDTIQIKMNGDVDHVEGLEDISHMEANGYINIDTQKDQSTVLTVVAVGKDGSTSTVNVSVNAFSPQD